VNVKKIDIEKLPRNTPEYPKEFFSKMQENVFCKIAKLEEQTTFIKRSKRMRIITFSTIAASIVFVIGIINMETYETKNTKKFAEEFNFYDNFVSNQETNNYSSFISENFGSILEELSYQELEDEVDKYEMDMYLEYLY